MRWSLDTWVRPAEAAGPQRGPRGSNSTWDSQSWRGSSAGSGILGPRGPSISVRWSSSTAGLGIPGQRGSSLTRSSTLGFSIPDRLGWSTPHSSVLGRHRSSIPHSSVLGRHRSSIPHSSVLGRHRSSIPHSSVLGRHRSSIPHSSVLGRHRSSIPHSSVLGRHHSSIPHSSILGRHRPSIPHSSVLRRPGRPGHSVLYSHIPGQRGSSIPGQWGSSISGQWDSSIPGQRDSSIPGQWGSSIPGQRDSSIPGQWGSSIPGQRDSSIPGQRDSSIPGQRGSSIPGQRDSSIPGQRGSSIPGQRGSSIPSQRGSSISGLQGSSISGLPPSVPNLLGVPGLSAASVRLRPLLALSPVSSRGRRPRLALTKHTSSLVLDSIPDVFSIRVLLEESGELFRIPNCRGDMTVGELKDRLDLVAGIPFNLQRLQYLDQGILMDESTLKFHDVIPGGVISLCIWHYDSWTELVLAAVEGDPSKLSCLGVSSEEASTQAKHLQRLGQEERRRWVRHRAFVALYITSHRGHVLAVKYLLEHGANCLGRTPLGRTPLHAAAAMGQLKCFTLLLRHGASVSLRDKHGETPMSLANQLKSHSVQRQMFLFYWLAKRRAIESKRLASFQKAHPKPPAKKSRT